MSVRKVKASERLGHACAYELLLCLASGGMGTVFLGRRKGAEEIVAIKRAHAHLIEDSAFRKMFVAEASLASKIHHPNAIGVTDVDESDGELLMIMRYVRGGSLSDLLSENHALGRRLPSAVALRIIVDVARGLHAAHSLTDPHGRPLGIIHRDVSPQNILVGVDGFSAIVDFGVAKAAMLEGTKSASDILKGKLAYMAPEYLERRQASPRSDVFSLGVVAWEALANARLFKGDDEVETMQRILDQTPAPFLSDLMGLDPGVAAIVARGVVKDPEKRFTSAGEFADALEAKARAADLLAAPSEVGAVASHLLSEELRMRDALLAEVTASLGPRSQVTHSFGVPLGQTARPTPYVGAPHGAMPPPPQVPPILHPTDLRAFENLFKRRSVQALLIGVLVLYVGIVAVPIVRAMFISYPTAPPPPTIDDHDEGRSASEKNRSTKNSLELSDESDTDFLDTAAGSGPPVDVALLIKRLEAAGYTIKNRKKDVLDAGAPGTQESFWIERDKCTGAMVVVNGGGYFVEMWLSNKAMPGRRAGSGAVMSSVHWMGPGGDAACDDQRVLDIATGK